jgi:ZIP family zinc transporter
MLEAFGWGLLAQSSLLVAGLLVCWVTVPSKVVGILGGFGAGAMIAAVSFDLLPEAMAHIEPWQTGGWMMVGVAVFPLLTSSSSGASAPKGRAGHGHRRGFGGRRRP